MGLMDKIKGFMNVQDDDIYDDDDMMYDDEGGYDNSQDDDRDISSGRTDYTTSSRDYTTSSRDYSSSRDRDYTSSRTSSNTDSRRNKYVNIHATTQLQVVLVKPESFQDATSIADHLNQKRTVVVNLESTSKDVSRRLVDFLSGVAYANQGQLKRVANSTFIITPFNVDIMGDLLLDELENSGLYL